MADFAMTAAFPVRPEIADAGWIRLGAAMKRLPAPPAVIVDSGKIRLGAAGKRGHIAR